MQIYMFPDENFSFINVIIIELERAVSVTVKFVMDSNKVFYQ